MHVFNSAIDPLEYTFDYNPVETGALRSRTYEALSISDLRRMALWKLDRVVDVPESLILKLQALAQKNPLTIMCDEARDALDSLVKCDGVSYPMASAFLKFIRPDVFPIIDVRAYRALTGDRIRTHQYSADLYFEYVAKVSDIAAKLNLPLARVDEQLYCYDKDKNGRIDA